MILNEDCNNIIKLIKIKSVDLSQKLEKDTDNARLIVEVGVIKNICEDIEFLNNLQPKYRKEKYFDLILRNCVEQLIIFCFLERKSENTLDFFEDYLGMNIDNDSASTDEFEILKNFGGKRTVRYKNRFYEMAKKFEDIEEEISIYKLYGMLADDCHNSYYHDITKEMTDDEDYDEKMVSTVILVLLTKLYEELERG